MFNSFADGLTALDICNEEAVRLLTSASDGPVDQKRLVQFLKEAAECIMRCWYMLSSDDGAAHFFPLGDVCC
jgi:hypothetical protein